MLLKGPNSQWRMQQQYQATTKKTIINHVLLFWVLVDEWDEVLSQISKNDPTHATKYTLFNISIKLNRMISSPCSPEE